LNKQEEIYSPEEGFPAGIGRRLGALMYDSLLILALWFLTGFIWVPLSGDVVTGFAFQLTLIVETVAFYAYCWHKNGETLGMRAWHIRLVDESGSRVNLQQIAIRALVAPFSLTCAGLGYLWLFIGDDRQTWHDRASKTLIVYLPR
jgi:uncharacterized RDD family membrane protein YckC|tara:strand:- start:3233 stop:3670 length:438 start_codon:yes stop_codon:yes gene_type:complete